MNGDLRRVGSDCGERLKAGWCSVVRKRALQLPVSLAVLALTLSACAEMPEGGPSVKAIRQAAEVQREMPYNLVDVSPLVLKTLASTRHSDFAEVFSTSAPAPIQTIGVGDVISVTIWDLGSGLFGSTPAPAATPGMPVISPTAGASTIPNQVVDGTGKIMVPFAGEIQAAGRTPSEVETGIRAALERKASNAQALVTVAQTVGAAVTVSGDVNRPGRVPLGVGGTRLLDIIAESGGTVAPASDMVVAITRKSTAPS